MKPLNSMLDLRSFLLGAFTIGGLLMLTNFKPARKSQPDPAVDTRRFQVVASDKQ